jgi:hypothetical protein
MATSKRELTSLGLLPEIKANYTAATRASAEHVRHAFATVRLIEEALPGIPHGEQEDFIAVKVGCPLTTYKRWRGFWRQYQALPESSTVDDLTSFEDIKRLSPPKPKPAPKQDASNTVDATPKPEQDAPDEEPAASDTDDTDVSTDDAGSVVCDDTQLDEAFEPVSWFERFKQLWDAADDLGRTAIRAFILGESKKKSKGFFSEVPIPASLAGADFVEAWKLWEDHRSSIKGLKAATKTAVEQQLKRLAKWGVSRSVAAIQHSVANSYQGIFEEKDNASPATVKKGRAAMEFTE